MMEPTEAWTIDEVAAFLRCSASTARRMDIPAVRLAGRSDRESLVRYDAAEVRAWWAARVDEARAQRAGAEPVARAARPPRAPRRPRGSGAVRLDMVG